MNLEVLWLVMLSVGVLLLLVALFLMLYWKIPRLTDELSGRRAKKQLARLKELSDSSVNIASFATDELNALLSASAPMELTVKREGADGSNLRDLIDDPYGLVGSKYTGIRSSVAKSADSYFIDEGVTGFLDAAAEGNQGKSIVLKMEQSSLHG